MTYALVGLLIIFLIFLFMETRRKARRIESAVIEEKRAIAEDSGMTASIGVFTPDLQTTVIIGASETLGVFYYRMLRQAKLINRSRINLANLSRAEFLVNGQQQALAEAVELPTLTLQASDVADRTIAQIAPDSLRQIQRAALKVSFYDESGLEKTLEITTMRSSDERHKFERVQLLKNTAWWASFLEAASRQARAARSAIEDSPEPANI